MKTLEKFFDKIIKLIDLKSFLTICILLSMIKFTELGIISNEVFVSAASMVLVHYFKKDSDKKDKEK